jgi:hypothetical protein
LGKPPFHGFVPVQAVGLPGTESTFIKTYYVISGRKCTTKLFLDEEPPHTPPKHDPVPSGIFFAEARGLVIPSGFIVLNHSMIDSCHPFGIVLMLQSLSIPKGSF